MKRWKKVVLGVAIALVALALLLRFLPGLIWGDGKDWSHVRSIRGDAVFTAWSRARSARRP